MFQFDVFAAFVQNKKEIILNIHEIDINFPSQNNNKKLSDLMVYLQIIIINLILI